MTSPTRKVRLVCWVREDRDCGRCSRPLMDGELHHRRPRGAGGSRRTETNLPGNLLWLCRECHAYVESHRRAAMADGLLVGQLETPSLVPLLYRGRWSLLDDDGGVTPYLPGDAA